MNNYPKLAFDVGVQQALEEIEKLAKKKKKKKRKIAASLQRQTPSWKRLRRKLSEKWAVSTLPVPAAGHPDL